MIDSLSSALFDLFVLLIGLVILGVGLVLSFMFGVVVPLLGAWEMIKRKEPLSLLVWILFWGFFYWSLFFWDGKLAN